MNRAVFKWIGFAVLGVVSFFVFIWLSLPIEPFRVALEQRLEAAMDNEYDVTILDMGLSGLTAIELEGVEFRRRPPPLKEKSAEQGAEAPKFKRLTMTIDRIEVDFALFKSLFGDTTVHFTVEQGDGRLDGTWSHVPYEPLPEPRPAARKPTTTRRPGRKPAAAAEEPEDGEPADGADPADDTPKDDEKDQEGDGEQLGHQVDLTFESFPLGSLSLIEATLGMPLVGTVNGNTNLLFSKQGQMLDGAILLDIERLALGPGEIPMDTPLGRPEVKDAIRIGNLAADIKVEGGKMEIEKFETTGPDVVLEANGNITLAPRFASSRAKLNARIKPSNEFLDKNALTVILNQNAKARRAKAGDWYGLLINGALGDLGKGDALYPSSRTASGLGKAGNSEK